MRNHSRIGAVSRRKVSNRFCTVAKLSSTRPLDFPRSSNLPINVSSGHTKSNTAVIVCCCIVSTHTSMLLCDRGYPSIRKCVVLSFAYALRIAFSNSWHVISDRTSCPAAIQALISSPSSDCALLRSARSKSPALKWTQRVGVVSRSQINWHCVPFPTPGAPRTKTTLQEGNETTSVVGIALRAVEDRWIFRCSCSTKAAAVPMNTTTEKGQIFSHGIYLERNNCFQR